MAEERLEIVSAVDDDFSEPLERFEKALVHVDKQIRRTGGGGHDEIRVDVEVQSGDAVGEIEAIDAAVEDLDDEATADLFDDEGMLADPGRRVGRDIDTLNVDAANVDIDAGNADVDAVTSTGSAGRAMASGGTHDPFERDPDSILPRGVSVGGFDSPNAASPSRRMELMGFLMDDHGGDTRWMRAFSQFKSDVRGIDRSEIFEDLRFTMRKYHRVIASLIPLVGIFVGALPAAITGVLALGVAAIGAAGALAGVGALGAMGLSLQETGEVSMQPIMDRLSELSDAFVEAFAPLARSLAPLIETAITEMEAMMGPLATASAGLLEFRGAFQGLFEFIGQTLPPFIRDILAFTDAVSPLLQSLVAFIADVDFFGFLAAQLSRAVPHLISIGDAIAGIIPPIVEISQIFLAFASGISQFIKMAFQFIEAIGPFGDIIFIAAGALMTASAAVSLFNVLIKGSSGLIFGRVIPAMVGYIQTLTAAEIATWKLYGASLALLTVVTGGLYAGLSLITSQFSSFTGQVGQARKELENFASTQGSMRGPAFANSNQGGTSANVYQDNSTTVINAEDRDAAVRQQYRQDFERREPVDSAFGSSA